MEADQQIICLNMIVKNEAAVIARCLASVRPIIHYWVIVDTGSTDGTQDAIRSCFADVPGELHERPWRDFAHNRTEALELAQPHGDYLLIMDADDVLTFEPGFKMPALEADSYSLRIADTAISYLRPLIVRAALNWRWRGVLHEFLTCEDVQTNGSVEGLQLQRGHDGARRRDPETYRRDTQILHAALETESDPFMQARYQFYLAQSYRDSHENEKALEAYLKRAELGFWVEEVFTSLCWAAKFQESLGRPFEEVMATYLRAADTLPKRAAEALHGASRYCRLSQRYKEGYEVAKRAISEETGSPGDAPDGLFVAQWIYEYGLLDEFAVNAYWTGAYRESLLACLDLLSDKKLPEAHRERITANAKSAARKSPKSPELGACGDESLVDQHPLNRARSLRPALRDPAPLVLIAILAKQKARALPLYLKCIEALDYPKSSIILYIRTNNNTDQTESILRDWVARVGYLYAGVELHTEDAEVPVQRYQVHEWNPDRFRVLAGIRNTSLKRAVELNCNYYFTVDVDNFIRPCTLREMVALNLPIAAPFLRSIDPKDVYSNYHAEVTATGYYKDCDQYHWILNRWIRGVIEMPVVHCTYLLRGDVLPELTYEDTSGRHEYVVFSESARNAAIQQYFDNRQIYGYITFDKDDSHYVEHGIERAFALLQPELDAQLERPRAHRAAE